MGRRGVEVIPEVLESKVSLIQEKVDLVRELSREMQVDIVDGLFADNFTVSANDLSDVNFGGLGVDMHLMVDDPYEYIEECVSVGCKRMTAQIERMGSQKAYVEGVHSQGIEVGLALDLFTQIDALEINVIGEVDQILLMSVKAGFSGQKFDARVVEKVRELRGQYEGRIVVDGGVNDENIAGLIEVGVNAVAVNSFMWKGDIKENMRKLYGEE